MITVGSVDFFGAFNGESAGVAELNDLLERLDRGEFDLVAAGQARSRTLSGSSKIKQQRYNEAASNLKCNTLPFGKV